MDTAISMLKLEPLFDKASKISNLSDYEVSLGCNTKYYVAVIRHKKVNIPDSGISKEEAHTLEDYYRLDTRNIDEVSTWLDKKYDELEINV